MATSTTSPLQRIWTGLSTADRVVLLGHDRDQLTPAELSRLAATAQRLAGRTQGQSRPRPRRHAARTR